jgi:peptide/nickel transport system substrate-binding protein
MSVLQNAYLGRIVPGLERQCLDIDVAFIFWYVRGTSTVRRADRVKGSAMTEESLPPDAAPGITRRTAVRGALATGATFASGGILAACMGDDDDDEPAGTPASGTKAKRGGTLTIAVIGGGATESQDAHVAAGFSERSRFKQLWEPLVRFDFDFNQEYGLAESMEPAKDAMSWDIRLRDGVEFHNGKTLGADDLIYTFRRILNPDDPKDGSTFFDYVDADGMKKLDKRTVRVPLKRKSATLDTDVSDFFSGIVPEGYTPKTPIGTGPFKFKSFTAGEESTFERNENYWQSGQPYLDGLRILSMNDDTARVNALLSGQVDAIMALPPRQVPQIQGRSDMKPLISNEGAGHHPITMRMDKAPFDDVRVRQAFRLIVDREQMIEQAYSGYAILGNDMPSIIDPLYNDSLPQREQDIEQAKSLLKAAGHENLSVEMITSPVEGGVVESAQVFAEQAKAAGVNVRVKRLDPTSFFESFPGWTFSQSYWGGRPLFNQLSYEYLPGSAFNEGFWENDQFTKLVADARAELDDAKQKQLIQDAQKILYDEGTNIIHTFLKRTDAYNTKFTGFRPDRSGAPLGDFNLNEVGLA